MTESAKKAKSPALAASKAMPAKVLAASQKPKVAAKPKAVPKTKPTPKPKTKPAAKSPVAASKKKAPATAVQKLPAKATKPHKQKMVRDSFTMPADDYAKLHLLKTKCLENGIEVKKSELIRAGLIALSKMSDKTLLSAVTGVERIKTGRPKGK